MENKTSVSTGAQIWLPGLWDAFGAKGIVALAWWTGALQAEQIRERMISYPILKITGNTMSGRSTLLGILWKLLGEEFQAVDEGRCSAAALMRQFEKTVNRPFLLVGESTARNEPLKAACFTGGEISIQAAGAEPLKFRGALVICGDSPFTSPSRLLERMVNIELCRADKTESGAAAVARLLDMPAQQAAPFRAQAEAFLAEHLDLFDRRAREFGEALLKAEGPWISARAAANHGQLAALVDVLALLLDLPKNIHTAARAEVCRMANVAAIPY